MLSLRNYPLAILLLFFVSCGEQNNDPVEQVLAYIPAEPVTLVLPEAIFTEPDKIEAGLPSSVVADRLIDLVDATPENGSIYISIYAFQGFKPFISSLKRAYSRNVNLHIMLDMSSHNEDLVMKNSATAAAIQTFENERDIDVVYVDNDAGSIAINHNKFILFTTLETESGTIENVVLQTSHNFTESDTERIQDAVILAHEGLYEAYFDYWQDMKELAEGGMKYFEYREFQDADAGITAFFYPKRKDGAFFGEDTIIEILNDITDPAASTIKIGMSGWTDSRVSIVNKLHELLDAGATVEVVTKSSIGPNVYDGLETLEAKGAFVKIYNMGNPDQQRINIHAKFMLIEGNWRGEKTNLVLTGSQNFSINALKNNNETSLLFRDHEFFERYNDYFEKLKMLPGICCP